MNFHLVFAISVLVQSTSTSHTYPGNMTCPKLQDCYRNKQMFPYSRSGVYQIYPGGIGIGVRVYCDMAESCGGWTVIQRRMDGSVNFYRDWEDYKKGFGEPDKNYWLGNDIIHQLTSNGKQHELLIVLEDFDDTVRYAHYRTFSIGSEKENYKLNVTGYSGNAGDSLNFHDGMPFSTHDQDHDSWSEGNCAAEYKGGWWFNACLWSNLNGAYLRGITNTAGLAWATWRTDRYSLFSSVMMIR